MDIFVINKGKEVTTDINHYVGDIFQLPKKKEIVFRFDVEEIEDIVQIIEDTPVYPL